MGWTEGQTNFRLFIKIVYTSLDCLYCSRVPTLLWYFLQLTFSKLFSLKNMVVFSNQIFLNGLSPNRLLMITWNNHGPLNLRVTRSQIVSYRCQFIFECPLLCMKKLYKMRDLNDKFRRKNWTNLSRHLDNIAMMLLVIAYIYRHIISFLSLLMCSHGRGPLVLISCNILCDLYGLIDKSIFGILPRHKFTNGSRDSFAKNNIGPEIRSQLENVVALAKQRQLKTRYLTWLFLSFVVFIDIKNRKWSKQYFPDVTKCIQEI